jgi:phosphoribosylanthranilate isomerase
LSRPFLLAGGISADNRDQYAALAAHPLFLGIDVDTNARGSDGKVSDDNVEAISRTWKVRTEGGDQDG